MNDARAPSRWLRAAFRALTAIVVAALLAVVAAWLIGRIATDRWEWSQWLWWIPTPIALAAALLTLLTFTARKLWLKGGLGLTALSSVMFVVMLSYFSLFEHRLLSSPPASPQGILVMHWTWTHTVPHQVDRHVDQILAVNPDIAFMTDGQRLRRSVSERPRLEGQWVIEGVSVFTILSRWPVLRARAIVANEPTHVALVEIDTTPALGRTTTLLLVNMPSELEVGRMEHMRSVRAMLDSADLPEIDVALGDFNAPRGSASLEILLPGMHHAFRDAGHGYAATFHRAFPLYHIDHIVLIEEFAATDYDTIDPGFGRHYLQLARIVLSGRSPSPAAAP